MYYNVANHVALTCHQFFCYCFFFVINYFAGFSNMISSHPLYMALASESEAYTNASGSGLEENKHNTGSYHFMQTPVHIICLFPVLP